MSNGEKGRQAQPRATALIIDPGLTYTLKEARPLLQLNKNYAWAFAQELGLKVKRPAYIEKPGVGFVDGSEMLRFIDAMREMPRPVFLRRHAEWKRGKNHA